MPCYNEIMEIDIMLQEKIILMYKDAGYKPDDVIKELAELIGAAMLAHKSEALTLTRGSMVVTIQVKE